MVYIKKGLVYFLHRGHHLNYNFMEYPNQISTQINNKVLNEIIEAIKFINKKLPNLVTLSKEEQCALPKMQENTVDFVLGTLKEARRHPELVPKNVDMDEIVKDVELIKSIDKILKPLRSLMKKLEDSRTLASSEAYLPSIAIYNASKIADILATRQKHHHRLT